MTKPTAEEVVEYFSSLSNWGRWGKDDQLGTLNFITPEKVARSAGLIVEGVRVSCSRRLATSYSDENKHPLIRLMTRSGDAAPEQGKGGAAEWIGLQFHGVAVTHFDALSHYCWDRRLYNGHPATMVGTANGAEVLSVEAAKLGVASRGILLDLPRVLDEPYLDPSFEIDPALLDRAVGELGIQIESGDVLLIRTGRDSRRGEGSEVRDLRVGRAGLRPDCLPWLYRHEISMLVGDVPHDIRPGRYGFTNPVHAVSLVAMGLALLDNAYLEDLADTCAELGRWAFFFQTAPLLLEGATGSPVNPIAFF